MAPIILATVLTTFLATSPANPNIPPVQMSVTLGLSGHSEADLSPGVLAMPTLSLTACLADSVVLDASAGWLLFDQDYAALGGWNWRVLGTPRTDLVVDLRALAGAHLLTENRLFGELPLHTAGATAAAELALTNWSSSGRVAVHARLRAGVETTGTALYPTAHFSLGAAF